jgi:hypothetical protein
MKYSLSDLIINFLKTYGTECPIDSVLSVYAKTYKTHLLIHYKNKFYIISLKDKTYTSNDNDLLYFLKTIYGFINNVKDLNRLIKLKRKIIV